MSPLDRYKELLGRLSELRRTGSDDGTGGDAVRDELEALIGRLSEAEVAEAGRHWYALYAAWPAADRYADAVRVLASIPSDNAPNDRTTPEARAKQRTFWAARRDAAAAEMEGEECPKT